ncbi:MAG: hypothetical protein KAX28_13265 [Candidatus Marinimicrobia bacterium]|nr:hypothetical protein [Candidatus Neomarinimicrobiota bacterium]
MLVIAFSTLTLISCAGYVWDASKPCTRVALDPDKDSICISGGNKCGNEEQMCDDGWFYNNYCTTVQLIGGACACRCY